MSISLVTLIEIMPPFTITESSSGYTLSASAGTFTVTGIPAVLQVNLVVFYAGSGSFRINDGNTHTNLKWSGFIPLTVWIQMANVDPTLQWYDKVEVLTYNNRAQQLKKFDFDVFRSRLNNDPNGIQEVRVNQVVSLTNPDPANNSINYVNLYTLPAGCIVDSIALNIESVGGITISGGSTIDHLTLGNHANLSQLALYGATTNLTQNQKITTLLGQNIAVSTPIDVCGALVGNSGLGSGSFLVGAVRFSLVYRIANPLPNASTCPTPNPYW